MVGRKKRKGTEAMRRRQTLLMTLALVALLCGLATGCHSKKALRRGAEGEPVEQGVGGGAAVTPPRVVDTLRTVSCHYYNANFGCTVQGIGLSGQVRMVSDSAVWVSVNKLIEVGRGLLTPARVQAYVKLANRYVDCGWGDVQRRWGVTVDYATVQALLLGNPPPQRSGQQVEVWCDKGLKRPARIRLTTNGGQRIECSYERMEAVEGQLLPAVMHVEIKSPKLKEAVTLRLEQHALGERKEMPFKMPKNYRSL